MAYRHAVRPSDERRIRSIDDATVTGLRFVMHCDVLPMDVDRSYYREMGGRLLRCSTPLWRSTIHEFPNFKWKCVAKAQHDSLLVLLAPPSEND